MQLNDTSSTNRYKFVDFYKGIGILLVFVGHSVIANHGTSWALFFEEVGGADVFFVLSGYLFFNSLSSGTTPWIAFVRRVTRIIPFYWVLVLIMAWIVPKVLGSTLEGVEWIDSPWPHLALVSNLKYFFMGRFPQEPLTIDWFVSCLIQVTLIATLLVRFFGNDRLLSVILMLLTAPLVRLALAMFGCNEVQILVFPLARLDSFAIGGVLAFCIAGGLFNRISIFKIATMVCGGLLGLSLALRFVHPDIGVWTSLTDYFLYALLWFSIVVATKDKMFTSKVSQFCVWLGRRSFGIYLVNLIVIHGMYVLFKESGIDFLGVPLQIVFTIICLVIGIAICEPLWRLDNRLVYQLKKSNLYQVITTALTTSQEPVKCERKEIWNQ